VLLPVRAVAESRKARPKYGPEHAIARLHYVVPPGAQSQSMTTITGRRGQSQSL
jgi:hypothetical protein